MCFLAPGPRPAVFYVVQFLSCSCLDWSADHLQTCLSMFCKRLSLPVTHVLGWVAVSSWAAALGPATAWYFYCRAVSLVQTSADRSKWRNCRIHDLKLRIPSEMGENNVCQEEGGFVRSQAYRSLRSFTRFYAGKEKNQVLNLFSRKMQSFMHLGTPSWMLVFFLFGQWWSWSS